jgi:hypothetical protein
VADGVELIIAVFEGAGRAAEVRGELKVFRAQLWQHHLLAWISGACA